ncbi:MAG: hypothetical protein QW404_03470, partial [Candidatus Nanoarchaeia archaeon]
YYSFTIFDTAFLTTGTMKIETGKPMQRPIKNPLIHTKNKPSLKPKFINAIPIDIKNDIKMDIRNAKIMSDFFIFSVTNIWFFHSQ